MDPTSPGEVSTANPSSRSLPEPRSCARGTGDLEARGRCAATVQNRLRHSVVTAGRVVPSEGGSSTVWSWGSTATLREAIHFDDWLQRLPFSLSLRSSGHQASPLRSHDLAEPWNERDARPEPTPCERVYTTAPNPCLRRAASKRLPFPTTDTPPGSLQCAPQNRGERRKRTVPAVK